MNNVKNTKKIKNVKNPKITPNNRTPLKKFHSPYLRPKFGGESWHHRK